MIEVVENLLMQLGRYGRWQIFTFTLICIAFNWPATWQIFSIVFAGARATKMSCEIPGNFSENYRKLVPMETDDNDEFVYSMCKIYNYTYTSANNITNATLKFDNKTIIDCPDKKYKILESSFETSIQTKFNLYCDEDYKIDLAHTLMIIGALVGSILLTSLSDIFGRKPYFLGCGFITGIVTLVQGFSPNMEMFFALHFFRGFFFQGVLSSGVVLACELWPADQRVSAGTFVQLFWATGLMILPGFAKALPRWDHLLFLISAPTVLLIPYFWLMPESVQWLISKGRFEQVREIFTRAARINKVPVNFIHFDESVKKVKERGNSEENNQVFETNYNNLFAIFYASKIWPYTYVQFFLWVSCNLSYYGLAFGTSSLGGDVYLNFFINGAVEIPAVFVCLLILPILGRRYVISIFYGIGALGLFLMTFIQFSSLTDSTLDAVTTTFAMIGKLGVSGVYLNLMFYTPELFPTTHRNVGLALCFVLGMIAGMVAPYIAIAAKDVSWLTGTIFAVLNLVSCGLVLLLPETVNRPLPEIIEDVQNWTLRVDPSEKLEFKETMKNRRNSSKIDILQGIDPNDLKKNEIKYLNRRKSSGLNLSALGNKPELKLEPSKSLNSLNDEVVLPAITKPLSSFSNIGEQKPANGIRNGGFFLGNSNSNSANNLAEELEKNDCKNDNTYL